MSRRWCFYALVTVIGLAVAEARGQVNVPGIGPEPALGNEPIGQNSFEPPPIAVAPNKIIQPLPMTAKERDAALKGIDRHVSDDVAELKKKLSKVLPDELAILAKTTGWTAEHQNALIVALRSADPAGVYKAWSQGAPQDTAGAELVARQTDVRRGIAQLEQDVQHHHAINQDLDDLQAAMEKIAPATPGVADLAKPVDTLKTWAEVRLLIDTAVPENGAVVRLPSGRVKLIHDPDLSIGQAVVLGNNTVMIGSEGQGPLAIEMGNAAEALGLPIVTGNPIPDAQGPEMFSGVILVNPADSRFTVTYNVNGNAYEMKPGMTQRLPGPGPWVVEYNRGDNRGMQAYTVADGTYWFTPTDSGLQLYRQRFDIVLDNTNNPQEFNFLADGKKLTVPANATRTISSAFPISIRFDRGNGEKLAAKTLNFGGNVEIGVNAADNLWDLFPTNQGQREVKTLRLFE